MRKKLEKNEPFSRIVSFEDNLILPDFFGRNDENLKKLENAFNVSIFPRGNYLKIEGLEENVLHTDVVLKKLYERVKKNKFLSSSDIDNIIKIFQNQNYEKPIKEY